MIMHLNNEWDYRIKNTSNKFLRFRVIQIADFQNKRYFCRERTTLQYNMKRIILALAILAMVFSAKSQVSCTYYDNFSASAVMDSMGYITDFAFDRNGATWILCYTGLVKWENYEFTEAYTEQELPMYTGAYGSIAVDDQNAVWLGSYIMYEGIFGITKIENGNVIHYDHLNSSLEPNMIYYVFQSASKEVWLLDHTGRIYILHDQNNIELIATAPGPYPTYIYAGENREIWIKYRSCQTQNCSIYFFNGFNWSLQQDPCFGDSDSIFVSKQIGNNFWVGTSSNGAFELDQTVCNHYNSDNAPFTTNKITGIDFDIDNKVWVGGSNYDFGYWWDPLNPFIGSYDGQEWTIYNMQNSCISDTIKNLRIDNHGRKWSQGRRGITVLEDGGAPGQNTCVISGRVYMDNNANQQVDSLEQGVVHQMVTLEPGGLVTATNYSGFYSFPVDTGSYTVTVHPDQYWSNTTASQINVLIEDLSHIPDNANFGILADTAVRDVKVELTGLGLTRCNIQSMVMLNLYNYGTIDDTISLQLLYDTAYVFQTTLPYTPDTTDGIIWDSIIVEAQSGTNLTVFFNNPDFTYNGDTLWIEASLTSAGIDSDTSNNTDRMDVNFVCAYDPNDKSVSPKGISEHGFVSHGESLTYTVRFQNTGNDTAWNVTILDTISPNLDLSTFTLLGASHPVNIDFSDNRVLRFSFNNIMLPDSNVNLLGSMGYVLYEIDAYDNKPDYSVIENTAAIYFDFNPAVITNTTINTMVDSVPMYLNTVEEIICAGDSILWEGQYYKEPGVYTASYDASGLDSVVILQLNTQAWYYMETTTLCDGDSLLWNGTYYNQDGTYYANFISEAGCDSLYELVIYTSTGFESFDTIVKCSNDTVPWYGSNVVLQGNYTRTYEAASGCDSVYHLSVTNIPGYTFNNNEWICEGDSILWRNAYYKSEGTYYDIHSAVNGCDSVYILNLNLRQLPVVTLADSTITINDTLCLNGSDTYHYYWYYTWNDTLNNYTFCLDAGYLGAGTYPIWLEIIDFYNCHNTDSATITILEPVGIYQKEADAEVYPNPFSGSVSVKPNTGAGEYTLFLKGMDGKLVMTTHAIGNFTWDLKDLAKGSYIIEIRYSDSSVRKLIIKN